MTRPKHLRLLRPFVLLALGMACVGSALGLVLLWRLQWMAQPYGRPWQQLHGQLQLFGFFVPFVSGFALFLVPRLAGGRPIQGRGPAVLALGGFGLGALGALVPFVAGGSWPEPVRLVTALSILIACSSAARTLHGPIEEHARAIGGRARVGYLWLLELAVEFLAGAGFFDALALGSSPAASWGFLDPRWAQAAWRMALEGFGVGMALAVSARMFTGFLGLDPSRAYPSSQSTYVRVEARDRAFWAAVMAWGISVPLGCLGELIAQGWVLRVADLLFALGAIPLALRLGLAPRSKSLQVDRSQDPLFGFAARGAYAMLVLAASVGVGTAAAGALGFFPSDLWADARRHLLALGFLMTLIVAMAGRLAPGYAGRTLRWPGLRTLAVVGFLLAALLRSAEAIAVQWGPAWLFRVSSLSGPVAVLAFTAFITTLAGTLLGAEVVK